MIHHIYSFDRSITVSFVTSTTSNKRSAYIHSFTFTRSQMVTYSIIFFLFLSVIDSQNPSEDHGSRHLWHRLVDKLADKYNVDNRHLNKEGILLFPDVGFQSSDNNWKIMVHGWKYQTNKHKDWFGFSTSLWLERIAKDLANQNDILYLNGSINRDRLRPFFVTDQSDKVITIQIGDKSQLLHTDTSGEIYEQIDVTNDDIQKQRKGNIVTYEATSDDVEKSTGIIRLIEPEQGLSVISDIDDTIKISEVLDKVRLLANTFIFPFKAVPGKRNISTIL